MQKITPFAIIYIIISLVISKCSNEVQYTENISGGDTEGTLTTGSDPIKIFDANSVNTQLWNCVHLPPNAESMPDTDGDGIIHKCDNFMLK